MRITLAALAGAALLSVGAALAQQNVDFSKVEIKTTDLGNKTYMLEGQGGNITVAVGNDGIIMVDSEFARYTIKSRPPSRSCHPYRSSILSTPISTAIIPAGMRSSARTALRSWRRIISGFGSPRAP